MKPASCPGGLLRTFGEQVFVLSENISKAPI